MTEKRTGDPTAEVIEALCDQVRWRVYGQLRGGGPMRARALADRLGVSEASMVRHLEVLERIGYVVALDPEKAPRWRSWEAVPGGLTVLEVAGTDPGAMRRWMLTFAAAQAAEVRGWVENDASWPDPVRDAALNYDYWMHLTPAELAQMSRELFDVTQRWAQKCRARAAERPEGVITVYVSVNAFPAGRPQRR